MCGVFVLAGEALLFGLELALDEAVEQCFAALAHLTDFLLDPAGKGIEHVFAGKWLVDLTQPIADALEQEVHLAQRDMAPLSQGATWLSSQLTFPCHLPVVALRPRPPLSVKVVNVGQITAGSGGRFRQLFASINHKYLRC
jgi:hypothetical protein